MGNNNTISTFWKSYPEFDSYILCVNGVQVASVQKGDESPWCIYAYESDFQELFKEHLGDDIPLFNSVGEAKQQAENVFHAWLVKTCKDILYAE